MSLRDTNPVRGWVRFRRPLTLAAGVISLALVILVVAAVSSPRSRDKADAPTADGAAVSRGSALLDQAERALVSGDVTRAVEMANRVLAEDPADERARQLARRAAALIAGQPRPSGSSGQATTAAEAPRPDDSAFLSELDDVSLLLPEAFEGYDIGYTASLRGNADVSAMPQGSDAQAFRISWGVRDRGTVKAAKSYVKKTTKELFSESPDDGVIVDGIPAYFGTDGRELACVAYRRGRFVFEVIVVADEPGNPEQLKGLAIAASQAFADAPPAQ